MSDLRSDVDIALDAFDPMAPGWPDFAKSLAGLDALKRLRAALAATPEPTLDACEERLTAWAGSVQRLVAVAPLNAVIDETGIPWAPHSTPPERKALRAQARVTVERWLARDLAARLHERTET